MKSRKGDVDSQEDKAPPYRKAIAQHRDPAKQALIKRVKAGNASEWDTWSVVIEHAPRAQFEDILDFFVNVPSLQGALSRGAKTREWHWRRIEPASLSSTFYYPLESKFVALLRLHAGSDEMIEEGWLLKSTHKQHPREEIKTVATTSYLLATPGYYAYVETYTEIDH